MTGLGGLVVLVGINPLDGWIMEEDNAVSLGLLSNDRWGDGEEEETLCKRKKRGKKIYPDIL